MLSMNQLLRFNGAIVRKQVVVLVVGLAPRVHPCVTWIRPRRHGPLILVGVALQQRLIADV